ncbi:MAG TPA: ATP-binding cassette domain-containing protein [Micromonosporaceae bacterium]|nr:ATP-binding cassette domain-containing protein [Micromonosporaceae bacterium]
MVVSVLGVSRRFARGAETVVALDDVDLELRCGELTVVAGPSGSGKTTLLSVVAGLETADSGAITTAPPLPPGTAPGELPWRHLAFLPQTAALLDELTVRENVDLPALLNSRRGGGSRRGADQAGREAGPAIEELLDRLEIDQVADRYPAQTSGGEQQRAGLARALRLRPTLLVADEPTGHQDRGRVDLVLGVLRSHAYSGAAVLISSHDEAVIHGADRVITLEDGRVVADRTRAGRAEPLGQAGLGPGSVTAYRRSPPG